MHWHRDVLRRFQTKLRLLRAEMAGFINAGGAIDPRETTQPIEHVENYLEAQIQALPEKGPPDTQTTEPNRNALPRTNFFNTEKNTQ
jgi:hypothetical protein